jgi:DNA-binding NtrC family response regulator
MAALVTTTRGGEAGKPGRVLIVDDNVSLAENVAEILDLAGYATEVSTSAEEALPRAMASEVTVMVTDYRLPGASGADLVRRVRGLGRQLKMIVMSAHTDAATIDDASDAGALAFVAKPLDFPLLTRLIGVPAAPN